MIHFRKVADMTRRAFLGVAFAVLAASLSPAESEDAAPAPVKAEPPMDADGRR